MRIFLSYEPVADEEFAQKLRHELDASGIQVTSINLKLEYGGRIPTRVDKLDQSVRGCDHVVAVLSKAYMSSLWMQKELHAFFALESAKKPNLILPVILDDCPIPPLLDDRINKDGIVADFRGVSFEEGFGRLDSLISKVRRVFVIMKFEDAELNEVYENAIEPVLEDMEYTVYRVDKIAKPGEITRQIYDEIDRCEVALADLTCDSPNCYFEAGYAYGQKKNLVLTARKGTHIPFDLATHHILFWEDKKELKELLREHFEKHILPPAP